MLGEATYHGNPVLTPQYAGPGPLGLTQEARIRLISRLSPCNELAAPGPKWILSRPARLSALLLTIRGMPRPMLLSGVFRAKGGIRPHTLPPVCSGYQIRAVKSRTIRTLFDPDGPGDWCLLAPTPHLSLPGWSLSWLESSCTPRVSSVSRYRWLFIVLM